MKKTKFTEETLLDTLYTGDLFADEKDEEVNEDLTTAAKKGFEKIAVDGKVHTLEDIETLEGILTKIFKANVAQRRNLRPGENYLPLNVLIIGDAGTGKSSIIKSWISKCEVKGKKIREFKMNGSQLNADQMQGVGHAFSDTKVDPETGKEVNADYADYVTFKTFDRLNPEDDDIYGSIFFIDEINRSFSDARAALLDMITSHEVADSTSGTNIKKLPKWVMTVAAMNPPDKAHVGTIPLDLAMLTRFYVFDWKGSIKGTRDYLIGSANSKLEQAEANLAAGVDTEGNAYDKSDYLEDKRRFEGQRRIAERIMTPKLVYDSGETLTAAQKAQKPVLNSRTAEEAIAICDGSDEDFLRLLAGSCGIAKDSEAYKAIKNALDTKSKDTDLGVKARIATAYDALKDFEDHLL